jgi:hypothetical protein
MASSGGGMFPSGFPGPAWDGSGGGRLPSGFPGGAWDGSGGGRVLPPYFLWSSQLCSDGYPGCGRLPSGVTGKSPRRSSSDGVASPRRSSSDGVASSCCAQSCHPSCGVCGVASSCCAQSCHSTCGEGGVASFCCSQSCHSSCCSQGGSCHSSCCSQSCHSSCCSQVGFFHSSCCSQVSGLQFDELDPDVERSRATVAHKGFQWIHEHSLLCVRPSKYSSAFNASL